ncbi:unnamed protein product [Prorocentrum cordatum]|uniref:EF-hand domain-containing protein n=3 Tax=Prorocentrum cordatum TaxID=2364126 RepID=A0ABN9W9V3_9DINO|nr:unnamed protein product [Polarella glacialis]
MATPPGAPRGHPPVDVPPQAARRLSSDSGAPPDPAARVARDLCPPVDVPPLEARRLSSPRGMFGSGAPLDPAAGVARDLWYELFMRLDDYMEQVGNMMSEASEERRSLAAAAGERHGELLQRVTQVSSEVSGFRPPSRRRTSAASTAPHEERAAAGAEGDGGGAVGIRQAMISPHQIASRSPADRPSTRSSCGSFMETQSAEPPTGACTAEGNTDEEAVVQPFAASSKVQPGKRFSRGPTSFPTEEQAMACPSGDVTPVSPGSPPVPFPPPPPGTEKLGMAKPSFYDVPMVDPYKQSHTSGSTARDRMTWCYEAWMNLKEPERTGLLANLERRGRAVFGFVIFANACWMTWFVDHQAKNLGNADDWAYEVEKAFLIIYCLELALAIAVHKYFFFCNDDAGWNLLDFLIVSIDAVQAVLASRSSGQFTVGRVLRALKIIRVLRVFRLIHFLKELRLIWDCMIGSIFSLFWSMVMMVLIIFMFSLVFVQGASMYLLASPDEDDGKVLKLVENFGSIEDSIISLYSAISGGRDWGEVYQAIAPAGTVYASLFLLFVGFCHVSLLNILTGIFVENALAQAQPTKEQLAMEKHREELAMTNELRRFLESFDTVGHGRLDVDEFFDMVVGSHLHAYLHSIGVSVKELREFVVFVGADKKGSISVDSLIHGCFLVRGNARNLDMQRALLDIKRIRLNQDWMVRALSAQWGVRVTSQREPHLRVWGSMTESQTLEDVDCDSEGQ